jgi:Xaa-Pro aminopeptidase
MPIGYTQIPTGPLDRLYRRFYRFASKRTQLLDDWTSKEARAGFRRAQKLAYDAVESVAKQLRVGMTEREAAQLLADYLKAHGTERYLHRPFAWFGEHAGFYGYDTYGDYHPSDRRLGERDVAILDVSPVVDGYIGDVGYAVSIGSNEMLEKAQAFQLDLRRDIPKMFASPMTPAQIWAEVDRRVMDAGFDNVHAKYPHCVLGHRVFKVKAKASKHLRLGWGGFGWFSLETNMALFKMGPSAALSPEHVGDKLGLWAIEPHVGWKTGGCKFEEILVVERDGAYWLDDDVPHVREAARR